MPLRITEEDLIRNPELRTRLGLIADSDNSGEEIEVDLQTGFQFRKQWRGYSISEVDAAFDVLEAELKRLRRENTKLKRKRKLI